MDLPSRVLPICNGLESDSDGINSRAFGWSDCVSLKVLVLRTMKLDACQAQHYSVYTSPFF